MRIRLAATLTSALALSACAATPAEVASTPAAPSGLVEIQILALNDFHGNLEVPSASVSYNDGAAMQREVLGGAARMGATLDRLREGHANTITVAAGDLIGASPFVSSHFLDEPAIMALNLFDLSLASVGNHEFDRGIAELQRMQNGGCEQNTSRQPCALDQFGGAKFTYLAGNVLDDQGESLFPATAMRDIGPARIGFVGLTLRATSTLVAPSSTAGLTFADEAETANRQARALLAQGADAVVLLIHEGGRVDPSQNVTGCPSLSGGIVPILERLDPAISVVVSGHTHMAYVCEIPVPGAGPRLLSSAGRYGGFVTDIRLTFDPATRTISTMQAQNVPVRESAGERDDIGQMVARYAAAAAPIAARVVGTIAPAPSEGEDCPETPAADLVADAQLAAARAALGEDVDIAFINTSGVRTGLAGAADGVMTYGEIFAMQPFGNVLQVLEMSGSELRIALEEQFCGEGPATPCFTLLAPSANLSIAFDRSRPRGQRVTQIMLDGRPISDGESYKVVFNNFLASGGDGFASLATRRTVGEAGTDLDALESWLARGATIPVCGRLRDLTPA